jgi:ABC-type multidrug transport system permease subunit
MSYYWGRALFCLFLASLSFSTKEESFVRWILSIYYVSCCGCFLALAVIDRERDKYQAEVDA